MNAHRIVFSRVILSFRCQKHLLHIYDSSNVPPILFQTGDLKGEEQFFIISAHNLLRQEAGARALVCIVLKKENNNQICLLYTSVLYISVSKAFKFESVGLDFISD